MRTAIRRIVPWLIAGGIGLTTVWAIVLLGLTGLSFADMMVSLGLGLTMGTLTGHAKDPETSWQSYCARRGWSIVVFYVLTTAVVVLYTMTEARRDPDMVPLLEAVTLVLLVAAGWVAGFVTGADKDRSM